MGTGGVLKGAGGARIYQKRRGGASGTQNFCNPSFCTKNSQNQYCLLLISFFPTMKPGSGGGGGFPALPLWLSAVLIRPWGRGQIHSITGGRHNHNHNFEVRPDMCRRGQWTEPHWSTTLCPSQSSRTRFTPRHGAARHQLLRPGALTHGHL